jgi:hypothetical protein
MYALNNKPQPAQHRQHIKAPTMAATSDRN